MALRKIQYMYLRAAIVAGFVWTSVWQLYLSLNSHKHLMYLLQQLTRGKVISVQAPSIQNRGRASTEALEAKKKSKESNKDQSHGI